MIEKKRRKIRRSSNPYRIIKTLGLAGGFLLLSVVSPLSGAILVKGLVKSYFRRKSFERSRFLADLKNLQKRELLDYEELPKGEIKIVLSKRGREAVLQYNLDEIKIAKPKRWDGKWRLIIFDIPHHQKIARNALREKLKQIGFYPVQKSVYLIPYECEKEIDFIASIFEVRDCVLIMEVSHFEGEEKLRNYFRI